MKVSKNVTLDFENVQTINRLQIEHHISTFSGTINAIIEMLQRKEFVCKQLEADSYKYQAEMKEWRNKYEKLKARTESGEEK